MQRVVRPCGLCGSPSRLSPNCAALLSFLLSGVLFLDLFTDIAVLVIYFVNGEYAAGGLAAVFLAAASIAAGAPGRAIAIRSGFLARALPDVAQRRRLGGLLGLVRVAPAVGMMESACGSEPDAAAAVAHALRTAGSDVEVLEAANDGLPVAYCVHWHAVVESAPMACLQAYMLFIAYPAAARAAVSNAARMQAFSFVISLGCLAVALALARLRGVRGEAKRSQLGAPPPVGVGLLVCIASACEVFARVCGLALFGAAYRWGLVILLAVDYVVKAVFGALTESRLGLRGALGWFAPVNLLVMWIGAHDDTPWSVLLAIFLTTGVVGLVLPAYDRLALAGTAGVGGVLGTSPVVRGVCAGSTGPDATCVPAWAYGIVAMALVIAVVAHTVALCAANKWRVACIRCNCNCVRPVEPPPVRTYENVTNNIIMGKTLPTNLVV